MTAGAVAWQKDTRHDTMGQGHGREEGEEGSGHGLGVNGSGAGGAKEGEGLCQTKCSNLYPNVCHEEDSVKAIMNGGQEDASVGHLEGRRECVREGEATLTSPLDLNHTTSATPSTTNHTPASALSKPLVVSHTELSYHGLPHQDGTCTTSTPSSHRHRVSIYHTAPLRATSAQSTLVLYIHGGAWRKGDKSLFHSPSLNIASRLPHAVVAVPNYRLSTPEDGAAMWPDHVYDVQTCLTFLLDLLPGIARVVVVGHSAGAFMGSWLLLSPQSPYRAHPRLAGLIGIAGIYDLPSMLDLHPSYVDFVTQAFGPHPEVWRAASPTALLDALPRPLPPQLRNVRVLIAHSNQDELLLPKESLDMVRRLSEAGITRVAWDGQSLEGGHDASLQTRGFVELVVGFCQDLD